MEEPIYVRMRNGDKKRIYRVVDDKTIDDVQRLVLMIVEGDNIGHYIEAYPEEVQPAIPSWREDHEFYQRIAGGPKTIVRPR